MPYDCGSVGGVRAGSPRPSSKLRIARPRGAGNCAVSHTGRHSTTHPRRPRPQSADSTNDAWALPKPGVLASSRYVPGFAAPPEGVAQWAALGLRSHFTV